MHVPSSGVLSRRGFLQAAAIGSGWLASASRGADVIVRTGKPYMKLSLAAYSFHRQLGRGWPEPDGKPSSMNLMDFIDFCAEMNLDGTELTGYYFPNPLTTDYLMQVKEKTFRLGLDISGTAIGNDFCVPDGPPREKQLALCKQWIDFAAEMGAPVIRIFAGKVPKGDTEERALERCVSSINESLQHAAKKGVALALENHGGITSTPEQLLAIVERVNPSPWFGVNFDSGNFQTEDPYGDLEKIAPYAINAQIKVAVTPKNGTPQPTDFKRVVNILKAAGYRGYLVLEYEDPDEPRTAIPKHLDTLRALIS